MARRREPASPDFSAEGVQRIIGRLGDEAEAQRAHGHRIHQPKPITLSTGRWIACSDCGGKGTIGWSEANRRGLPANGARARGVECPRCSGGGEVPETRAT